jgi:hypothetical protein
MSEQTSAYLVTPPSLFFPRRGLSFALLTRNAEWVENFMELAEQQFQSTTLTFFSTHEETDDEKWIWMFQQASMADFVIVDAETVTDTDIHMGLIIGRSKRVWWEFTDETKPILQSLLNITQAGIVDSTEEFFDLIADMGAA